MSTIEETNLGWDPDTSGVVSANQPVLAVEPRLLSVVVTEPAPGVPVVHVIGEVDLLTAPQLRAGLAGQLATEPRALVVDCTAVSFLSARGLAVLDETARAARQQAAQLRVVAASRPVCRVLAVTRLDETIPVHASLHDALNYCMDMLLA